MGDKLRKLKSEGGKVNMCTTIRDMVNKGKLEGRAEGKAEGKAEEREIIICNRQYKVYGKIGE